MRRRRSATALFLISVPLLANCDQTVTDPTDTSVKSVEVVYDDEAVTVELGALEEIDRGGEPHARLSDVVEAAELGVPLEELGFDFEASDGFRSSSTSTCVDVIPMAGGLLEQGYVHTITRNLAFEAELDLPGCVARLQEMVRILAADASTP